MTTIATKERPILYNGPMVRAVLSGAKRQTRRICKEALFPGGEWAAAVYPARESGWIAWEKRDNPELAAFTKKAYADGFFCPLGVAGDRLWVRETLNRHDDDNIWYYAADAAPVMVDAAWHKSEMVIWAHHTERDYCPSIHMPRWASRITQTITEVRVERVQDITDSDALAEGVAEYAAAHCSRLPEAELCPWAYFELLWDSINKGAYSWECNPWVYVLSFEPYTVNDSTKED